MKGWKHYFWAGANFYALVFARSWLAPFHYALLTLSLHGLGFDNIYKESYTGEEWFVRNILKKARVTECIDIGANIGLYSTYLATNLECRIYAIEPATLSFVELQKTAARFPGKIIPIRTALFDFTGIGTIFSKSDRAVTATLERSLLNSIASEEQVPVTTLDALVESRSLQKIDFIKIDTEGFEREVLRGMEKTLRNLKPKFVQFEFNLLQLHRGYSLLELARMLEGYEFYRLLPHGWLKINPQKFASNIYMYNNVVAKRKEP